MNNWSFTGGITRDCETRFTPSGSAVTSFSVAVSSGYGDNKVTQYPNCSLWGKQAESLAPYLKKGSQVAVTGELTLREYDTKDGGKGKSLDLRVSSLTLIGGKPKDDGQAQQNNAPQAQGDGFDDNVDVPF